LSSSWRLLIVLVGVVVAAAHDCVEDFDDEVVAASVHEDNTVPSLSVVRVGETLPAVIEEYLPSSSNITTRSRTWWGSCPSTIEANLWARFGGWLCQTRSRRGRCLGGESQTVYGEFTGILYTVRDHGERYFFPTRMAAYLRIGPPP
jgi:hypothetical protein